MKLLEKFLMIITFCSISTASFATVCGGESVSVLGYDAKDQKVYVLRDYEDGRARVPQLYYFDLKSKSPQQIIEVTSLYEMYRDHQTQKIEYGSIDDDNYPQFEQKLNAIKQRLVPLKTLTNNDAQLDIVNIQEKPVVIWFDEYSDKPLSEKEKIPQYTYHYQISSQSGQLTSQPQTAISYAKDLRIQQFYAIPNQPYRLANVRYLGIGFETGYHRDDVILLLPKINIKK
ncbi:aminotransferase [Acinetobacter sp. c2-A9]|uniref:aminotransferase n=1 Tax=Acinetobacter sp. c2-A9 TaxID=3342802 RepID=UPI0035B7BA64